MPARSPKSYLAPVDLLPPPTGGALTIRGTTDIPARLFGGNAQSIQVDGLNYVLHLDIAKLAESAGAGALGKWTVVWDQAENTYRRVEFTNLPAPAGVSEAPVTGTIYGRRDAGWVPVATISTADPSGGVNGDVWYKVT